MAACKGTDNIAATVRAFVAARSTAFLGIMAYRVTDNLAPSSTIRAFVAARSTPFLGIVAYRVTDNSAPSSTIRAFVAARSTAFFGLWLTGAPTI